MGAGKLPRRLRPESTRARHLIFEFSARRISNASVDYQARDLPWPSSDSVCDGGKIKMVQSENFFGNLSAAISPLTSTPIRGLHKKPPYRHLTFTGQTIVTVLYLIGIVGSVTAFYILHKEKKIKHKNKKHLLMLRCLIGNDLVALVGMLIQMYIQLYLPAEISSSHTFCVFRVVWRWFGLASGCLAIVMAVERWLALTHPFFYQKNVTYNGILKAVLLLWSAALALVCMPFFGFGLYFDNETKKCTRYRLAVKPVDVAYAYLFFLFGLILCTGISCANLSVTKSLCHPPRACNRVVGHRISRSFKRQVSSVRVERIGSSTPGEVAFARLMVALSISFLICWLPQLLSIPLAQFASRNPKSIIFFRAADVLMAIHFTLDPYIYVLLHHHFPCLNLTFELLPRHCCCARAEELRDDDEPPTERFTV